MSERVRDAALRRRIATASEAAACITPGETVAVSGFTGAGYPKAVPRALAARMQQSHAQGDPFRVRLLTGASTAPELDGALAKVEGMEMRLVAGRHLQRRRIDLDEVVAREETPQSRLDGVTANEKRPPVRMDIAGPPRRRLARCWLHS